MADFPLILAGPVLRRFGPSPVSVLVALSQPKSIRLIVYEGRQQAGIGPDILTGWVFRTAGATNTVPIGVKFHIGDDHV